MNKNDLENINKKLKKKGCEESDVFYCESRNISSTSRLGKIEKTENSEIKELGIRAIFKQKQSIISTTNLEKKNIDLLIEKVFEMTKVVPKNEFCGLASSNQIKKISRDDYLKLDQIDSYTPTPKDLNNFVLTLENSALDNKKIINSEGAEISCTKNRYILLGSNGLEQEYEKSHSDFIIAVLAGNSNSMEREYDYKSKVFFNDLGDFKKIGSDVSKKAIKKLNSKKVKTCRANVIFDSKVSSSLLNNLFSACNSSSIIRGTSFLKNKIRKQLFSKEINIIDDPRMKGKLRSKIADCEGIESQKKHLIENGKLNFFFNSLATARQLKKNPTGHASRDTSSLPGASCTNLYMEKGKERKKDLIRSLKKGLLITELMGSSINFSNGDYSRGASGFWIENGEIVYPVSEITVAGNLKKIFSSLIAADDLEFDFSVNAPSCLVENMTIGGL